MFRHIRRVNHAQKGLFRRDAGHNYPCWPTRGVVVNQDSTLADEVRAEVGHDEVVGLGVGDRFDGFDARSTIDAVQHGSVAQFFSHSPAGAGHPERVTERRDAADRFPA